MHELLSVAEMGEADRLAVQEGACSFDLMERAGQAVAESALALASGPAVVLCGPGNNGGDGYVAACRLAAAGREVRLAALVSPERLKGDAARAASSWDGAVLAPDAAGLFEGAGLVVDALFGAGLARPLDGPALDLVRQARASGLPILAVDVPSGLDGDSGQVLGDAPAAAETVTFFRLKPGHVLLPGRLLCGRVRLADIGIPARVLETIGPRTFLAEPALWGAAFPWPAVGGHKYGRGHAVALSGPATRTGAARLAARGALRAGAGLVTLASPPGALAENAAHLTAIMLRGFEGADGLAVLLEDGRLNAIVMGPGCGVGPATAALVRAALDGERAVVLDADALTSFAGAVESLAEAVGARPARPAVLTPHEGEFARLFPGIEGAKPVRARKVAALTGAIVVLKGPDTVVAAPDGRAAIARNAPPHLATAGAGDVLAGMMAGLMAQSMPAFEAAAAAVWLHGEAAAAFGPGLIAEDLPEALPKVLQRLERSGFPFSGRG